MLIRDKLNIIHGDNMEYMATVPDNYFDLAVVDPPYGINIGTEIDRSGFKLGTSKNSMTKYEKSMKDKSWDNKIPSFEYFRELFRASKNQIIWGGNYFLEYLTNTRCIITWDKMTYIPTMSQVELAWTSFSTHSQLVKINSNQLDRLHPTQKPVALYDWIYDRYATENCKVIDTHLGSGSNAIAAHYSPKVSEFVGIEIDEDYYNDSVKRIIRDTQQLKLF